MAVKNKNPKNGIAMHVQETVHTINWQQAKILGKEDIGEEKGSWSLCETNDELGCWSDFGSNLDTICSPSHMTGSDTSGGPTHI